MAELNITSDVASKLIDKVSDALGGVLAPWQTKRMADAEGRAAIIRAQADAQVRQIQAVADIEAGDLQRRAALRWVAEETRHQANMESITAQAIPLLGEEAKPEGMNDDWMSLFLHECRHTSEAEMQALWAKVLAGEANSPGSFSKRTLTTLAALSQQEARWFSTLCCFIVVINDSWSSEAQPIVLALDDALYQIEGMDFTLVSGLSAAGLITYTVGGYSNYFVGSHGVQCTYFEGEFTLNPALESGGSYLPMGEVILSPVGQELARICKGSPVSGFMDYLRSAWRDEGFAMEITRIAPPPEPIVDDSSEYELDY